MDLNKELEEIKSKMTPMNTAKFLAGTVISLGAYAAIVALLKTGLAGNKGVTKLLMKIGIFVLACKAGDAAKDYFDGMFDNAEKEMKEMKDEKEEK